MDPRGMNLWEEEDNGYSPIAEYFRDKVVLLTGATGFIGKIYVEKLIRCGASELILIIREKRGVPPAERMTRIFDSVPVMKSFQRNFNNCRDRVKVVRGDMSEDGLGLDPADVEYIRQRVQIVLHVAADVRFDETLFKAIQMNVKGTWEMLNLCASGCPRLEMFVYVSTAYANCLQGTVHEQFYDPPMDPMVLLNLVNKMDAVEQDHFEALTQMILGPWPNTYTYAKALAESLVKRFYERIPVMIIRPPIVVATFNEPIQGWVDNLYGMNGAIVGIGCGVLRVIQTGPDDMKNDVMPADFVVNGTLAAIKYTVDRNALEAPSTDPDRVAIYHVTSSVDNPLTNARFRSLVETIGGDHAPLNSLWIGTCINLQSRLLVRLLTIVFHVIPGIFIDAGLKYYGKKTSLMNIYRKVARFTGFINYFATHEFIFVNDKMHRVLETMTPGDREKFHCDIRTVTWEDVFNVYVPGLKLYMRHEGPETWIASRERFYRLKKIGLGVFYVMLAMVVYWILPSLLADYVPAIFN
ncbi:fatty acyl-CoA reductase wat-like [Culex pipiens pallens]|uniref:fatty acyl-CoA reductase wat-like n=1 Tax=Culex pipiens pallens TaxID=42434 RepID=UPI0019535EAF|nr:fatty acyl-CoA reductase wat-like [Culex pipiens pallens]